MIRSSESSAKWPRSSVSKAFRSNMLNLAASSPLTLAPGSVRGSEPARSEITGEIARDITVEITGSEPILWSLW